MYNLDRRNSVTIETALQLAHKHYDEKTFNHAMRVAAYVASNHAIRSSYKNDCIALAIMHDLVEDTSYNAEELKYESSNFYKALQLLTKKDDVSYVEYCRELHPTEGDPYIYCAYMVKLADMKDHLMLKETLTDKLKEKYLTGLAELL